MGSDIASEAAHLRAKADETRQKAWSIQDVAMRAKFLETADDYELTAARLEQPNHGR